MEIMLPYGKKHLPLFFNNDKNVNVEHPKEIKGFENPSSEIINAMRNPLETGPLSTIVSKGDNVAIVVDDYTRPAPTKLLLPPLLEELHNLHIHKSDITILIATGTHKSASVDQKNQILGKDIAQQYTVISNDVENGTYVTVGTSSFGHQIDILEDYVNADVKILTGDIEYHYYAGYGGTRKSVLPGVASKETIQLNHSMMFDSKSAMGVYDDNPISKEMIEALEMAGCDFSLSAVLNSQHQIVGVWAGNPLLVMKKGINLVDEMYKKMMCQEPDIAVFAADGHPHDINLYQALKALYTGSQIVKKNGVIILVAKCPNGMGNDLYRSWMDEHDSSLKIQHALKKHFVLGAHKAFYHRNIIENYTVILISELHEGFVRDKLGFIPMKNPNDALDKAYELMGKDASVLIAPQGSTTYFSCE